MKGELINMTQVDKETHWTHWTHDPLPGVWKVIGFIVVGDSVFFFVHTCVMLINSPVNKTGGLLIIKSGFVESECDTNTDPHDGK